MPQYRTFNASNQPDSCLWCGNKLRRLMGKLVGKTWDKSRPMYSKTGDYGDGFFCGLRCAYQFAVAMAENGKRFNPTTR